MGDRGRVAPTGILWRSSGFLGEAQYCDATHRIADPRSEDLVVFYRLSLIANNEVISIDESIPRRGF